MGWHHAMSAHFSSGAVKQYAKSMHGRYFSGGAAQSMSTSSVYKVTTLDEVSDQDISHMLSAFSV